MAIGTGQNDALGASGLNGTVCLVSLSIHLSFLREWILDRSCNGLAFRAAGITDTHEPGDNEDAGDRSARGKPHADS